MRYCRPSWSRRLARTLLVLALISLQSGCALWPQLAPEHTLARRNQDKEDKTIVCLDDRSKAIQCAEETIAELSELLNGAGYFGRGSAYGLLGIGTATAGAAAFGGTTDLLKGLALGAGSIVALNEVAGVSAQRQVVTQGLESVRCVYAVAKGAIAESGRAERRRVNPNARNRIELDDRIPPAAELQRRLPRLEDESELGLLAVARVQQQHDSLIQLDRRIRALDQTTPALLGAAVIEIRQTVRRGLHDAIPALREIVKLEQEAVDQMTAEVIRAEGPDVQLLSTVDLAAVAAETANAKERLERIVTLACEEG